ncbi:MAG: hypothetical protein FI709_08990 [SAR202 cluster bacterium]|nr:hypothetical protein [SAR202 cluster bacterium]|tara:strand:+ start:9154 stop:9435 length:282 start_codon:yes stop_codon:yes gene_type:complete
MENATALDALIREIGVEALAQFQAGQGGLIEDVVKPIERLRDLVPTLFDHDLVDILGGIRALSQLDTRLVPFTIVSTARKLGEEAAKPIPMML